MGEGAPGGGPAEAARPAAAAATSIPGAIVIMLLRIARIRMFLFHSRIHLIIMQGPVKMK